MAVAPWGGPCVKILIWAPELSCRPWEGKGRRDPWWPGEVSGAGVLVAGRTVVVRVWRYLL